MANLPFLRSCRAGRIVSFREMTQQQFKHLTRRTAHFRMDCFRLSKPVRLTSRSLGKADHKLAAKAKNCALLVPNDSDRTLLVKRAREWFQRSA